MNKATIYITRTMAKSAIDKIRQFAEVDIWPDDSPVPYEILEQKINQTHGLVTMINDRIDASLIDKRGPKFQIISQMGVGFDNIDTQAATQAGIPVGHTPGVLTETCADFTMGLILAVTRRIVESNNEVREGIWRPWGPDVWLGEEVNASTLGIIGFGRIGQAVAKRASSFGMKILYHDLESHPEFEKEYGARRMEFKDLLKQADIVSLHTTLNKETFHLIDQAELSIMKPDAILINTSRGGVVNPDALYQALRKKQIKAAALDVFEPEPIPPDHPILKLENVIITPHIASASTHTRKRMAEIAAENLIANLQGKRLPHCANPQVYADHSS